MLSLLRAWIQSLVEGLRSQKLYGPAKKKKKEPLYIFLSLFFRGLLGDMRYNVHNRLVQWYMCISDLLL